MEKEEKNTGWEELFGDLKASASPKENKSKPEGHHVATKTSMFLQEALKEKRFQTVGMVLLRKGHGTEAAKVADAALREGKFEQAISIYSQLGLKEEVAKAYKAQAMAIKEKKGPKKLVANALYRALQTYWALLPNAEEDRLRYTVEMLKVGMELTKVLQEMEDHWGCAETALYCAQLCKSLLPLTSQSAFLSAFPEVCASLEDNFNMCINMATENYRLFVNKNKVAPNDEKGKLVVSKLKIIKGLKDAQK